jgi:amino acid transporter
MKRQLTLLPLTGIIYFTVSGGAFGLEEPVAAAGPGLALLMLILTPLLWSVPIALVTAEMSTMLPLDGGYYRWVYFGLGRTWGFMEGWWTWLFTFIDMAIYPVLFATYANFFFYAQTGRDLTRWERWAICLMVILTSLLINLRGAKSVGRSAVVAFVVVTIPFLLLTALAATQLQHAPWQPFMPTDGRRLSETIGVGLSALMWSYMGWDNVSTFAGEVQSPGRTFPLALLLAVLLVTLLYVLPISLTLGATSTWSEWNTETHTISKVAAEMVGSPYGQWLGGLISFGVMWSLWCLFNSQLLYTSRIPFAMAEDGLLPRALTKSHPRWDTPWVSLLLCSLIYSLFSLLSFDKLVVIDVIIYSIALLLEYVALIALRIKRPDLPRPFSIPGGWAGIALSFGSLLLFALAAIVFTLTGEGSSWQQVAITALMLLSGPLVYFARATMQKRSAAGEAPVKWLRELAPQQSTGD